MFFLSAAIGQRITWVAVLVVVLVLHHLDHFLFKINLSEKKSPNPGIQAGPSDPQPRTHPLSYRGIDMIGAKINFYISPQTLDQYWSTLVISPVAPGSRKKGPEHLSLKIQYMEFDINVP